MVEPNQTKAVPVTAKCSNFPPLFLIHLHLCVCMYSRHIFSTQYNVLHLCSVPMYTVNFDDLKLMIEQQHYMTVSWTRRLQMVLGPSGFWLQRKLFLNQLFDSWISCICILRFGYNCC